jgi:hypothetical protein
MQQINFLMGADGVGYIRPVFYNGQACEIYYVVDRGRSVMTQDINREVSGDLEEKRPGRRDRSRQVAAPDPRV